VALITVQGEVGVSRAYVPDHGECDRVAVALRDAIGLPEHDAFFEPARALARSGHIREAIRLLCEQRRLSLSDAQEQVEALRKEPKHQP
jgi:hypothetical protein